MVPSLFVIFVSYIVAFISSIYAAKNSEENVGARIMTVFGLDAVLLGQIVYIYNRRLLVNFDARLVFWTQLAFNAEVIIVIICFYFIPYARYSNVESIPVILIIASALVCMFAVSVVAANIRQRQNRISGRLWVTV